MTETQRKAIVKAYMNIISPLRQLVVVDNGMARFDTDLAHP